MRLRNLFIVILFLLSFQTFAQLESYLGNMSKNDIDIYVKPMVTTLGTAINSGGYNSAFIGKDFGVTIAFNAIYIMIPESQRSFLPTSLDPAKGYDNTIKVSTVFGAHTASVFTGSDGFIAFPGGFNLSNVTVIIPQVALHLYNTELLLRFVPEIKITEKKISMFGFGLRHSVSQYFELPVDIAVHGLYNTFKITDMASSKNTAFGFAVSKTFGMLTPYAGMQLESSQITFDYKITEDGKQKIVNTDVSGENKIKFTLGGTIQYGIFALNLDFNLGNQNNALAGISFNF